MNTVARLRSNAARTASRWRRAFASLRTEPEGERFVILAQGRTGSTLLTQLVGSHPQIVCDGEIFAPRRFGRIRNDDRHLRGSINMVATRGAYYGFKVKPYELEHHGLDVRTFLERRVADGWAVIHLSRSNFIRHALSTIMLEQDNARRAIGASTPEAGTYRIDPAYLIQNALNRREWLRKEGLALDGIEHYAITYERHLVAPDEHQGTADGIFTWLQLPSSPVQTRTSRQNPDDLSTMIANYDELLEVVEASEFAGMLAATAR